MLALFYFSKFIQSKWNVFYRMKQIFGVPGKGGYFSTKEGTIIIYSPSGSATNNIAKWRGERTLFLTSRNVVLFLLAM